MRGENLFIRGHVGDIECQIQYPDNPRQLWIILHPHPLYGGKMNNPILYHLRKVILDHGGTTLSFNFRGVGLSDGTFTGGKGELDDTLAVYRHGLEQYPDLPISVLGYSFGAMIGLDLARDIRLDHLVLVGFPLTTYAHFPHRPQAASITVLQGEKDEFGTPDTLAREFTRLKISANVCTIPASNHFFENHLHDLLEAFRESVFAGTNQDE